MPIIPRVTPAALPGVRQSGYAPPAAFGAAPASAGLNEGLSAIHSEAARIAQEETDKADQVALTDARGQLMSATTDLLFGQNGVLTRQGKDAFTAPEDARDHYEATIQQIRAGLGNDRQRQAFSVVSGNQWNAINEQVQSHVASQRQKYDTQATGAAIENAQNLAVQSYDKPDVVESLIAGIRDTTKTYGARNGWGDDQTKEMIDKRVSETRVGVISRMLDSGNDLTASKYYAEHKADIDGADQAKIEKALDIGSTQGEALRVVNKILATKENGVPIGATAALAQAEAIESPKVRNEAIKEITAHFNETDRAQRIDRENARARVLQSLRANKGRLNEASSDWRLIAGYPEGEHVLVEQHQILHPPADRGDPEKYFSYLAMAHTSPATRDALMGMSAKEINDDPTLSPGQKSAVLNLIVSERHKDVTDLVREESDAQQEAKRLLAVVERARKDGNQGEVDANTPYLYAAQQKATLLRGRVIAARRAVYYGGGAAPESAAPASEPSTAPAEQRPRANPLGLTPAKPITPEMLNDLAKYGEGYADYLRKSGYAVPAVLPVPKP